MYSVVIPTYRRKDELITCIRHLFNQSIKPSEIVISGVKDDIDTKETVEYLAKEYASETVNFKYVTSLRKGIATQRNRGLETAEYEYILMIDDDVEIPPHFVETAIAILQERNGLLVTGFDVRKPVVKPIQNLLRKLFFLDHYARNLQIILPAGSKVIAYAADKDVEAQWLSTTVLVMRKEVTNTIKFDETLVNYSHREDQDFSYSVYKRFGKRLILSPRLSFTHHHSSRSRVKYSKFCHLYVYNTFFLFRKHFFDLPKNKLIFTWSMIGIALQGLNHSFQHGNISFFYETMRALIRVINSWHQAKLMRFGKLYEPVSI